MTFFWKNISYLREKSGFTQVQVAEKLGIMRNMLSNYELNKNEPDFTMLLRFASFYDISVDEILRVDLWERDEVGENGKEQKKHEVKHELKHEVYPKNDKLSLVAEPGDLTVNSGHKDVIDTINKLRHDVDRLQRSKDKPQAS